MANFIPSDALSDDVPDSTDWLGTPLSGMAHVESALRCQVCKDFFTTPMTTACAHTFCSLCIRKCLSADAKCPACRSSQQEVALRHNGALEDVVEAFVKARPAALGLARKPVEAPGKRAASPKRRINDADLEDNEPAAKRTRSSARTRNRPSYAPEVVDLDQETEEEKDAAYEPDESTEPPAGFVSCPMCQKHIKYDLINTHLDDHLSASDSTPPATTRRSTPSTSNTRVPQSSNLRSSNTPENRPKPLPALHYSLMKDTALRKKLQELGIASHGSKLMLEKRHTEWVNLWNANCDALRPKTKGQLLHELDIWERTQGSRAPTAAFGISGTNSGNSITRKDFDAAAWGAKHGQDFNDLIANARKSMKEKAARQFSEEGGSSSRETEAPDEQKEATKGVLDSQRDDQNEEQDQQPAVPTAPSLASHAGSEAPVSIPSDTQAPVYLYPDAQATPSSYPSGQPPAYPDFTAYLRTQTSPASPYSAESSSQAQPQTLPPSVHTTYPLYVDPPPSNPQYNASAPLDERKG